MRRIGKKKLLTKTHNNTENKIKNTVIFHVEINSG